MSSRVIAPLTHSPSWYQQPCNPVQHQPAAAPAALKEEIEGYARGYGLDFYETIFEVIDADDLNEVAAYGGFPTRYPHWSFGMSYEELRKGYDYGLSKIYEMVINNDPCYAYLMRSNHTVDQKLVMAHVYGHCDFFKNNAYFAHTNRKMMDEMANHGARIRRYVEKYGEDEVEAFMDRCMSIDDLIDIHSTAIRRRDDVSRYDFTPEPDEDDDVQATRFKSKDYMDDYINPRDVLKAEEDERRKAQGTGRTQLPRTAGEGRAAVPDRARAAQGLAARRAVDRPRRGVLLRAAGQTKIMNEGWACLEGDTFTITSDGVVRLEDLVKNRRSAEVSDGENSRRVYDWATFTDRETITIRTRRGLELAGSVTHRVLLADGNWKRLDELAVGDRVRISGGNQMWAADQVRLNWKTSGQGVAAGSNLTQQFLRSEELVSGGTLQIIGLAGDVAGTATVPFVRKLVSYSRGRRRAPWRLSWVT